MPHHHDHSEDRIEPDWAVFGPMLEQHAEVYAPVHEQIARWLGGTRPDPGLIVDVGSGPGAVSCLLAQVFPGAEVVAVDAEPALLARAGERARGLGLDDRVRTLRADLPGGLDVLGPADLIWAGRSLHHLGDQRGALAAFAERLAPGGVVALLEGGLPPRSLPRDIGRGRPGLESRLDAAETAGFARMRAELPGSVSVVEHWPDLLEGAGLRHSGTRSFLLDVPAPLPEAARQNVLDTFTRRREALSDVLDADDLALLDHLLDPAAPDGLARRSDLFLLAAQTVHAAVKEG